MSGSPSRLVGAGAEIKPRRCHEYKRVVGLVVAAEMDGRGDDAVLRRRRPSHLGSSPPVDSRLAGDARPPALRHSPKQSCAIRWNIRCNRSKLSALSITGTVKAHWKLLGRSRRTGLARIFRAETRCAVIFRGETLRCAHEYKNKLLH